MKIRTYSELITLPTFKERFDYLNLHGTVGIDTFGFDRYLNQKFYRSREWKHLRDDIFMRDNGNDLAMEGYPIYGRFTIHHMNPIQLNDIRDLSEYLMNPEYLITTIHKTHNAIHYGDAELIEPVTLGRSPGDTKLW